MDKAKLNKLAEWARKQKPYWENLILDLIKDYSNLVVDPEKIVKSTIRYVENNK